MIHPAKQVKSIILLILLSAGAHASSRPSIYIEKGLESGTGTESTFFANGNTAQEVPSIDIDCSLVRAEILVPVARGVMEFSFGYRHHARTETTGASSFVYGSRQKTKSDIYSVGFRIFLGAQ